MGTNVGKLGGFVSYFLNDELVTRSIGKVTHWSDAQYAVQLGTSLVNDLLAPLKDFVNISMHYAPKPKKSWSAFTLATSENKMKAITGVFPDLKIDYTKVVLAIGKLPAPVNPKAQLADGRITFSWEADLSSENTDPSDRVMCVAYFPETFQAFTIRGGAKRTEEIQHINLPSFTEEMLIETYMCFISEDRKEVSDSIYLGQLIWTKE